MPLDNASEALRLLQDRKAEARLILVPGGT
jgi:hypothetical protein